MTGEYSEEVKNLQTAIVKKLSGNLAPIGTLKIDWDLLLDSLSHDNPLSEAEIQGISTMQQLFRVLMDKQFIDYGKYGKFLDRLRPIHPNMASKVKEYEDKILAQIKRDSLTNLQKKKANAKYSAEKGESDENEENDNDANEEDDEDENERSTPLSETERLKLQANMILELSDCLCEKQKEDWARFKTNLGVYFKPGVLSDIHHVMDAFNMLNKRGHVELGVYDVLREMVHPINTEMSGIIDRFSAKINRGLPAREREPTGKGTKRRNSTGSERNVPFTKKPRNS